MAPLSSKQKISNRSCSTLNVCIGKRFALIRFQGTLSRQFSKPSPCFTIHTHHGNQSRRECPRKQLLVFCQKSFCKSVQNAILSLPKGGPPRDSQTGWFPRNLWPPKCQFRSWKFQFKLKLSHGVIVFETKILQQQLFHP